MNVQHAYGQSSMPIAQGLVYNINDTDAFGLRESKRIYGSVSTPIAQGLRVAFPTRKDPCSIPQGNGFFSLQLWDLGIFENLSLKCLWDGSGVSCNVAQPNSR